MDPLRLPQQLQQFIDLAGVPYVTGEVFHLVWVVQQVEKLGLIDQ